jgi:hypothetical protein
LTAGSSFIVNNEPAFGYYLGNAFLDCVGDDKDHTVGMTNIQMLLSLYAQPVYDGDGSIG